MRKLAIGLALTLCASITQAKEPRNQWGRTPAQERAVMHRILNCCKVQQAQHDARLTALYGPNGSLVRARVNAADCNGWVVDDQRDQPHYYYAVCNYKQATYTCATDPSMEGAIGQVCVSSPNGNASYQQALADVTRCAKDAPGYTPSVELDTDGVWRAYCVPGK